jgi:hypothetical protein
MKLRIVLLAIAVLGFVAGLAIHFAALLVISEEAAGVFQSTRLPLYLLAVSGLYLFIAMYFAMNDGLILVGIISWIVTLFGSILRTAPYMLQALGLFIVYALVVSLAVPSMDHLAEVRSEGLLIAFINLLSMASLVGRLHAQNPLWYKFGKDARKSKLPTNRVRK